MFKKRLFLYFLIGVFLFLISSKIFPKHFDKVSIFIFSLENKILSLVKSTKTKNLCEEKYFLLLKELAELKSRQPLDIPHYTLSEKYNLINVEVIKNSPFGFLYLKNYPFAHEGDIVVDSYSILVGRVKEVKDNIVLVEKINKPGMVFNLMDSEDNLLGVGETSVNGFIEINSPFLEEIKSNYVFTAGNDNIFPRGLLVGEIVQKKKDYLLILPLADPYFEVKILKPKL